MTQDGKTTSNTIGPGLIRHGMRTMPFLLIMICALGLTVPAKAGVILSAQDPAQTRSDTAAHAFNWQAGRRRDEITPSAQQDAVTRAQKIVTRGANWICSPSGSGHGSHCRSAWSSSLSK